MENISHNKKSTIRLDLVKSGKEMILTAEGMSVLRDLSLGITESPHLVKTYCQSDTVKTYLIVENNAQWQSLLNGRNFRKVDLSSAGGRYLLQGIFTMEDYWTDYDPNEKELFLSQWINLLTAWLLQQTPSKNAENQQNKLQHAFDFIRLNIADPDLSVKETAHYCRISVRILQKYFQSFDLSFTAFVNDLRLANAAQELFKTETPITRIAFQNGFSSSAYFTKRFKEKYKTTPKNYRQREQAMLFNAKNNSNGCPITVCNCKVNDG
ncbi:hypothetical protein TEHAL1_06080 [Tetragenococcus halophilus]|nr:AraC family transcriptional regulator [Tetragenococcus halophilus]MDN6640886.1 AraC family transcriptional regulator [Tetragenococcus sp.]MDN6144023.1 AraC family transcriptional regulator [Tetragenococcus halophilus]GEQ39057.1 AraC family transcriptional regulator [Tetragenococcus halophilus]GEQ41299.1 AraC family transcriptional regulator [Tetragenococcus halophilus]GEQ43561.1 AraC family transcriptional regulator [Tetragenococcus halophilus]